MAEEPAVAGRLEKEGDGAGSTTLNDLHKKEAHARVMDGESQQLQVGDNICIEDAATSQRGSNFLEQAQASGGPRVADRVAGSKAQKKIQEVCLLGSGSDSNAKGSDCTVSVNKGDSVYAKGSKPVSENLGG